VIKLFSLSVSLIILMQSFGMHVNDISQMDEFIEHAQFHNEQYGDSIIVFIAKHYGELKADHAKDHQEEKEDHEQLPFQHQSHLSSSSSFILNSIREEFKTMELPECKEHNFHYQEPSSSLHLEGLFQPPRLS
jgi:hypothetical protein